MSEEKFKDDIGIVEDDFDYKGAYCDMVHNNFIREYKFTSDLVKEAVERKLKEQQFQIIDGSLDGASDFMEAIKENNPGAFIDDSKPYFTSTTKMKPPRDSERPLTISWNDILNKKGEK